MSPFLRLERAAVLGILGTLMDCLAQWLKAAVYALLQTLREFLKSADSRASVLECAGPPALSRRTLKTASTGGLRSNQKRRRAAALQDAGANIALAFIAGVILVFCSASTSHAAVAPDTLADKPIGAKNADGHLELFKVDREGELWHRWQNPGAGEWSSWKTLGNSCLPGISLATTTNGELVLFAVGASDHGLRFIHQQAANSHEWSDWALLGGPVAPPVAIASGRDGRLQVFAADPSTGSVKHLAQTQDPNLWSEWNDLGGNLLPGVAVECNRDGRLELFGIARHTGELMHSWQQKAGLDASWSGWNSLGGAITPGFVAGTNVLGRVELFAVSSTNAHIQRIAQQKPGDSSHYTDWEDLELKAKPRLAIGQSGDKRLELMAVDADDSRLMHRWEMLPNGADKWSKWDVLGTNALPCPALVTDEDGDIEVFTVDARDNEALNHRRQISHASGWLDWSTLEHPVFQYNSRIWQTDEGLPDNNVQAIVQGRDGYLWVGTHSGLARFDGIKFTFFDSSLAPELRLASVTALCAERGGALWVGTQDHGLFRIWNGRCARFSITNGLPANSINNIYERRDGSIWVGTTMGVARFTNGLFSPFVRGNVLASGFVRSLFEDQQGNLWIATGERLLRLRGDAMDNFAMPQGLPDDSVRCICQDRGGRIWIGSNNGMLWFGSYWQKFFAYDTRFGLSDPFVSAICEDREGNLWVGTYSGLNRFREGRFSMQLDNEGVPFGRVNTLFEDRESNLWVGTKEGLVRLTPKRFSTITRREGLTHNNVMAVIEHQKRNLWVATWGGGLCTVNDGRAAGFSASTNLSESLVLSLAEGHDGSLWIGYDFDGGLTRLTKTATVQYTWRDGLPKAPVRVLSEDRGGTLWIGTENGLATLKDGRFTVYTTKQGLPHNAIRAIREDHAGNLWIGTEGGLCRFHGGQFVTIKGLSDEVVLSLYEDSDSVLWIGTAKGGLDRLPLREDGENLPRITAYTTRSGMFSDEIFEILEDSHGWLWMSCSKGVFRVKKRDFSSLDEGNRDTLVSLVYGKSDGMESPQCNCNGKPAAIKAQDGKFYFATTKGLAAVDPETVSINLAPPPVRIEQLVADKTCVVDLNSDVRDQEIAAAASLSFGADDAGPGVKLPPGRGDIEFDYTALTFQSPQDTQFKYKLEGVDSDWVDAGTRRVAFYNNVPPGRHRFRVMASNKDGAWNQRGAAVIFSLEPHFWQSWWWRAVAVCGIIAGVSGTVRYVTSRRLERKLALLEQHNAIERERGRIAKDIHDDLGSSLTRIMMLGERAEEDLEGKRQIDSHIGKIVTTARHTVRALDEIVWAVNPDNDTLDGLVQYISHYANEFFENTPVSCLLDIPTDLPHAILTAEFRHDLFLVVKEAFNNVLKHANATRVRLQMSATPEAIEMIVEDNGAGFNADAPRNGRKGNGLSNMRKRSDAISAELSVTSRAGHGTTIKITAPLRVLSYNHTVGAKAERG